MKLLSLESVMPSNHIILCRPFLLLSSVFPSVRVFSNMSAVCIKWPKSWSFSFSISPSSEYSGLVSFRMDWLDRLAAFTVLADSTQDSGPCRRAQGTCFVCARRVTDETAYWARRCTGHLYMVCCTESPPDPRGRQATVTLSWVLSLTRLRSPDLAGMSISGQGHMVKWCYHSGLGLPTSRLF